MGNPAPISEARGRLHELVELADEEEVVLLRHGRPYGVLLSHDGFERLLDRVEDLEDEISILRREEPSQSFDDVRGRALT